MDINGESSVVRNEAKCSSPAMPVHASSEYLLQKSQRWVTDSILKQSALFSPPKGKVDKTVEMLLKMLFSILTAFSFLPRGSRMSRQPDFNIFRQESAQEILMKHLIKPVKHSWSISSPIFF